MRINSSGEDHLAFLLKFAGYDFVREFRFSDARKWRADFLIKPDLLVEVEGVKFEGKGRHQTAEGFAADCEKYNEAAIMGFKLLRFTPAMIRGDAKNRSRRPYEWAMKTIARTRFGDEIAEVLDYSSGGYASRMS